MTDPTALKYWPAIHFAPPQHWLNDPNGLVRVDGGWRLYFQHSDSAPDYRRIGWATAFSDDLLHWRFDGWAIAPQAGIDMYSGSVVAVCQTDAAAGARTLRAYYTANRQFTHGARVQTQQSLDSADGGATFSIATLGDAPLLDEGLRNFRDPFVLPGGSAHGGSLAMLVAKPVDWNASGEERSTLAIYRSHDARRWEPAGSIGPWDEPRILWETPWIVDLVRDDGQLRSVLAISRVDRRNDTSGTHYWVGRFDGQSFEPETCASALPLCHGPDYYAAIPALDVRGDRSLTVAWLGNWMYARQLSVVAPWHGGLIGIPRHLQLTATAAGSRLRQRPIDAVTTLREGAVTESRLALLESTAETSLATHVPIPGDWDVMLELGTASAVTLSLFDGAIAIALERNGALLTLQRASRDGLPATFATRQEALREKPSRAIRLRMLVDTCAIELFADDGATTFSALVFPPRIDAPIRARATAGTARITLSMWALRRTALPPCGAGNIARPL